MLSDLQWLQDNGATFQPGAGWSVVLGWERIRLGATAAAAVEVLADLLMIQAALDDACCVEALADLLTIQVALDDACCVDVI